MLVSIIIPLYNVEQYIERCLTSVFKQTYTDIEIILVDDCSPDNSLELAKNLVFEYGKQDIVKFIDHESNKGLSGARNSGIRHANGDYIYLLDSDDSLYDDNSIQYLVNYIDSSGCFPDVVIGNLAVFIDGEAVEKSSFRISTNCKYSSNKSIFNSFIAGEWYTMAQNKLVNTNFLRQQELFFFDGVLHEDILWSFSLAMKAKSMIISTQNTYNYFMRTNNSITSHIKNKNLEDLVIIYNRMVELLSDYSSDYDKIQLFRYMENTKLHGVLLYTIKLDKNVWTRNIRNLKCVKMPNTKLILKDYIKRYLMSLPPKTQYTLLNFWKR